MVLNCLEKVFSNIPPHKQELYILDNKYIFFEDRVGLMFDAKTGERYYGIDEGTHTDTVYMPDGEDGKTEPQISFWGDTDKIIVVYKLYDKLYIRRLN